MSWGTGCATAIGVVFVLIGGCMLIVWGAETLHPDPGFADVAIVGVVIGVIILSLGIAAIWGAVHTIRSRRNVS